ncbi:hypothetical protein BDV93DRAFT_524365 [Ceratobasidium sp. AG-I]|nr:hypothetical protein BDV93DRAFT_524365 [Ceratobasidium sp. AG-I]
MDILPVFDQPHGLGKLKRERRAWSGPHLVPQWAACGSNGNRSGNLFPSEEGERGTSEGNKQHTRDCSDEFQSTHSGINSTQPVPHPAMLMCVIKESEVERIRGGCFPCRNGKVVPSFSGSDNTPGLLGPTPAIEMSHVTAGLSNPSLANQTPKREVASGGNIDAARSNNTLGTSDERMGVERNTNGSASSSSIQGATEQVLRIEVNRGATGVASKEGTMNEVTTHGTGPAKSTNEVNEEETVVNTEVMWSSAPPQSIPQTSDIS